MPKRFTATEKWEKVWFQNLSVKHKCLWNYLCDKCDSAGVWDANFPLASFQIGEKITPEDLKAFEGNLIRLESGSYWLFKFVFFQNGELSKECPAHKPVFKCLEKHGLSKEKQSELINTLSNTLLNTLSDSLCHRLQGKEKERERGKEEGRGMEKESFALARVALFWLNEKASRQFRETADNLKIIKARLAEVKDDIDGVKRMIDRQCAKWKNDPKMCEYLTVDTLFRASNFSKYYDMRNAPLNGQPIEQPKQNSNLSPEERERLRILREATQ